MVFARKLFINWHTKSRQRSDTLGGPDVVDRLKFAKYENAPLYIVIVEPKPEGGFQRVDVTGLSLAVRIHASLDSATPHVEQTSWSKVDANTAFSGNLNLATAAMNSYVGSSDKTPYFEVQITDGTGALVKALFETCNVVVGVGQIATVAPDALVRYPTFDEMLGICATRVMKTGESITWIDENGVNRRTIGVRTDGTPQDDAS